MRQFGIHELRASRSASGRSRRVMIIQHDRFASLRTRIVVPLYGLQEIRPVEFLTADIEMGEDTYRAAFDQSAAVDLAALGPEIGFREVHDALTRAIDLLFTGV